MKEKVTAAWNAFKLFCASQAWNFYVGLTISALVFLSLFSYLPIGASACLVPIVTPAIYSGLRYVRDVRNERRIRPKKFITCCPPVISLFYDISLHIKSRSLTGFLDIAPIFYISCNTQQDFQ